MGNLGNGNFTRWRVQKMGSSRDGDCSSYLKIKKTKVAQNCLNKNFGIGFASIRENFSIFENSVVILKNVEKFQEIFVYVIEHFWRLMRWGIEEMGSAADGKFTRQGVEEMGAQPMGSSRYGELKRLGVHEMGSSVDGKFTKRGVQEMMSSADGKFTGSRVQEMGNIRNGDCSR